MKKKTKCDENVSQKQANKSNKGKLKKEKKIYTYYSLNNGKIVLNLKKCPRCGAFMAHHKERERWACGSCGYTNYVGG